MMIAAKCLGSVHQNFGDGSEEMNDVRDNEKNDYALMSNLPINTSLKVTQTITIDPLIMVFTRQCSVAKCNG